MGQEKTATEEWTAQQCAAHWGIKAKTWHGYVSDNRAPKPARHVGRTPLWDAEVVRAAKAKRPGAGARTDRHQVRMELRLEYTNACLADEMPTVLDENAELEERERAASEAGGHLMRLGKAMGMLRDFCGKAGDEEARSVTQKQKAGADEREVIAEDEMRALWFELAEEFGRLEAEANDRASSVTRIVRQAAAELGDY